MGLNAELLTADDLREFKTELFGMFEEIRPTLANANDR